MATTYTAGSADDAVQTGTTVVLTDTRVPDPQGIDGSVSVGFRFPGVVWGQGVTIISAKLKLPLLQTYSTGNISNTTLYGEATDNSSAFSTAASDITNRARTSANKTGSQLPADTSWQSGVDVTSLVQEIVNRGGWVSGNAISLLFIGTGTAGSGYLQPYLWDYYTGLYKASLIVTSTITTTKAQTGKAAVKVTTTKTTTGKAKVVFTPLRTQTGISHLSATMVRTQTGKGNLRNNTSKLTFGLGAVRLLAPKTLTGKAAIRRTFSYTTTGKATIFKQQTHTVTGKGRVANKVTRDLLGTARIAPKPVFGDKRFEYKVYSSTGTYLGNISADVASDFGDSQEINSAGSSIAIRLSRPADDFSEGMLVAFTNELRVYVHDQEFPNGHLLLRGEMVDYKPVFASNAEYVEVTVMGYGHTMSQYMLEDGSGNTSITYSSVDPSNALKDAMDKYNAQGGPITYDSGSIDLTGTTVSYPFISATIQEVCDKILELSPAGWYYYVDQATNKLHFHQKAGSADHTFVMGTHIQSLSVQKRIEDIVNVVYFTGGDDGTGANLFQKRTNTVSTGLYGHRAGKKSDGRVKVTATANVMCQIILDTSSAPELRTELIILDNAVDPSRGYDLESVILGQMIRIFGTSINASGSMLWDVMQWDVDYWDYSVADISSLVLQVTKLGYTGNKLSLSLSTVPPDVNKRIEDLNRNLDALQTAANPSSPS